MEEGRLLVWRESHDARSWPDGEGPSLFGSETEPRSLRARLESCGIDWGRGAYVDIETCGLGDAPVFLVGVLTCEGDSIHLAQFFAPDPTAERDMLLAATEVLRERVDWVSFNGRSFDVPRLRHRARTHRVAFPECASHVDLLHEVRRRWKGSLPNCRLSTVEERLLGLRRLPGDVPGREVPDRYYDFVHGGERRWIDPVIEHNRRDIAALLVLRLRVAEAVD